MNTKNFKKTVQSGFTLVELIIVIVIVGILAAVAIPKLTDTSKAAYAGVATATQGALKSAWSSAYAINKGVLPKTSEVAAQMADPLCTGVDGAHTITCVGVTTDGTPANLYVFTTGGAEPIASPTTIQVVPVL